LFPGQEKFPVPAVQGYTVSQHILLSGYPRDESPGLFRFIADRRGQGWTLFHIGRIAFKQNHYPEALIFFLSAHKIFKDIQSLDDTEIQSSIDTMQELIGKEYFDKLVQRVKMHVFEILDHEIIE
jgi:hypothetical protein